MSAGDILLMGIVLGMVSYRLWRMAAIDSIFDRLREKVLPPTGFFREMVDCPWCLPTWINGVAALLLAFLGAMSFASALVVWLVASTVTGVIGRGD